TVKEPVWYANIKPGVYDMQIRSYDDRGVPGAWSPPEPLTVKLPTVIQTTPPSGAVVSAHDQEVEEILLRWEPVPNAAKYHVIMRSRAGKFTFDQESLEPQIRVRVPVATVYDWNVTAISPVGDPGDENPSPTPFEVHGPPLPP